MALASAFPKTQATTPNETPAHLRTTDRPPSMPRTCPIWGGRKRVCMHPCRVVRHIPRSLCPQGGRRSVKGAYTSTYTRTYTRTSDPGGFAGVEEEGSGRGGVVCSVQGRVQSDATGDWVDSIPTSHSVRHSCIHTMDQDAPPVPSRGMGWALAMASLFSFISRCGSKSSQRISTSTVTSVNTIPNTTPYEQNDGAG